MRLKKIMYIIGMYILYTAAPFVVTMLYVKKFVYTFASETGKVYFVT